MLDGCLLLIVRTVVFATGLFFGVLYPQLLKVPADWLGLTGFVFGWITLCVIRWLPD